MFLLLISFIAGVLTTLAPCTIALLPVIVGGSLDGGHSLKRAWVVTLSLGVSVILFTFLLKVSTLFINVPQNFWSSFSGVIIFILGIFMVFPLLWEELPFINKLNLTSNRVLATGYKKKGILGDIIMGAALGPIFSSCSPTYFLIIATVLPRSFLGGLLYLLSYVIGMCGMLLFITFLSQKAIERLGMVGDNTGWLKRIVGILFIVLGVMIFFGYDKKAELFFSSRVFDVTKIEQRLLPNSSSTIKEIPNTSSSVADKTLPYEERIKNKNSLYILAPEITNPSGYVNTDNKSITFSEFKGKKVVLVDFWTYSCINCQRTIPYINAWYDKYHDQGLEIIGIHTPEFSFEKVLSNVEDGVKRFGIKYPVVLDNDYGTWSAFQNQYWPRKYLIDIDGYVVYDHAGEGNYNVTEEAIQKALKERAEVLGEKINLENSTPKGVVDFDPQKVDSPETYFGYARNEYFSNGKRGTPGLQNLLLPESISLNKLYLSGSWNFNSEYAEGSAPSAKIIYKYDTKNVYFVASSVLGVDAKVILDGKDVTSDFRGDDVDKNGVVHIKENRLYKIIEGAIYGEHTLEIQIIKGTLEAYTFTFG